MTRSVACIGAGCQGTLERFAVSACCVCEITEIVGKDLSTVSRHLSQLKNAGLVVGDKRRTLAAPRLRRG